jgi:nucleotide-binding universal stress UspA family protein
MLHLQKILFPVDFSERAIGASHYVRAMTERFHSDLTLLHVVEPSTHDSAAVDKVALRKLELQQFLQTELRPFRVSRIVREGDPARIVVSLAQSEKMDLIMMPTHGWGVYRRFILGSVTAKVLHDAACLVWTCSHAEQASREKAVCRKILCAVDLGPMSKRILDLAYDLAQLNRASLVLVHVCQTLELEARERAAALAAQVHPVPEIAIGAGDVAATLQRIAAEQNADLVVIGRSTADAMLGRLRSNAYSIIRQTPCPVISV